MAERPILFSAPMVRAILAGTKTQTRRVVKPQPDADGYMRLPRLPRLGPTHHSMASAIGACPYGLPGDRLWVRESWNVRGLAWGKKPREAARIAAPTAWLYAADDTTGWQHGWRPTIYMPRAAARLLLEVADVRVERLQDITEEDARAEGVDRQAFSDDPDLRHEGDGGIDVGAGHGYSTPRSYLGGFFNIWQALNAKRAPWASNPFVWVVSFRRVEVPRG